MCLLISEFFNPLANFSPQTGQRISFSIWSLESLSVLFPNEDKMLDCFCRLIALDDASELVRFKEFFPWRFSFERGSERWRTRPLHLAAPLKGPLFSGSSSFSLPFDLKYIDLTSFLLTLVVACLSSVLFLTLFSISWFSISLQSFSPLFSLTSWCSDALLLLSGDRSTVFGLKKFFIVTGGVVALINVLWLMGVSASSNARLAFDGCLREGSVELKTPLCLS